MFSHKEKNHILALGYSVRQKKEVVINEQNTITVIVDKKDTHFIVRTKVLKAIETLYKKCTSSQVFTNSDINTLCQLAKKHQKFTFTIAQYKMYGVWL